MDKAQALINEGRIDEAAMLVTEARQKNANDKEALVASVYTYWQWADALEEACERDKARIKMQSAAQFTNQLMALPDAREEDFELAVDLRMEQHAADAIMANANEGIKRFPNSIRMQVLLARGYIESGRYSDAYAHSMEMEKKYPNAPEPHAARGQALRKLGLYDQAVQEYQKALELSGDQPDEKLLENYERARLMQSREMTEDKFWAHYNAAEAHHASGRYDKEAAEKLRALEVLDAMAAANQHLQYGNEYWHTAKCHEAVAEGFENLGEYEQSVAHSRLAVQFISHVRNPYANAYTRYCCAIRINNYANSLPPEDDKHKALKEEAITLLRECVAMKVGHVDRHAMALLVGELCRRGECDSDEVKQLRAAMVPNPLPEGGANGDCSIEQAVTTEADIAVSEGNYARAVELYEWATGSAFNYSLTYTLKRRLTQSVNLVDCYRHLGNDEKLIENGEAALTTADNTRKRMSDDFSKRELLGDSLTSAMRLTADAYLRQEKPDKALALSERYKGRALMELLRGKALIPPEEECKSEEQPAPETAPAPQEEMQIASLDNQEIPASTMRDLHIEETAIKQLAEDTRISKRAIASLGQDLAFTVEELQPAAKDFTFVSYIYDDEGGIAIVMNSDSIVGVPLPALTKNKLNTMLAALRESYQAGATGARDLAIESDGAKRQQADSPVAAPSEELYDTLVAPLREHLTKPLLYISTDGGLNYLPFDLLQKNGHYLVQDFAIAYTPSATFLKWLLDKPAAGRSSILAIGNPNLKNPAFRLVNAGAEAQAVRTLFSSGDAFLEDAATESAVYAHAQEVDILHFACHGQTNEDNPMLSSLRLALDDANDGYLHAGEVFDMSLKPSLVVLSACNSGVGEVSSGNELMGLTRSFFYAGAQSIIASLWFVDDRSTSELMQAFYKNLSTMNIAEALRQAKLETMAKYPDPIHWAPFAMQGDYR